MDKFVFRYLKTEAGWIDVELTYGNFKSSNYTISYVFSSPLDIIEWAEKVSRGENVECYLNGEGWEWGMGYDGRNVFIFDTLNLNDDNPQYKKKIRVSFPYDRKELCTIIYSSFEDFIRNGIYKPEEWEKNYGGKKLSDYKSKILKKYLEQ